MKYPFSAMRKIAYSVLLLLAVGCASAGPFKTGDNSDSVSAFAKRIEPMAEALFHHVDAIAEIYGNLRAAAHAYAFLDDAKQLDYIQKAALYVEKAHMLASHQLALLHVIPQLRAAALPDFCILRYRGLERALQLSIYDRRFLGIYQPFINDEQTAEEIARALVVLEKIEKVYRQELEAFAPLAHREASTVL